jgi:hypothetical protein
MAFSKLKAHLHKAAEHTITGLIAQNRSRGEDFHATRM